MKFIRFTSVNNKSRSGILKNESEVVEITGDMFGSFEETGNIYPLNGIKFLPPSVPRCDRLHRDTPQTSAGSYRGPECPSGGTE